MYKAVKINALWFSYLPKNSYLYRRKPEVIASQKKSNMKKLILKSEESKMKKFVNENCFFDLEYLVKEINERNYDYLRYFIYFGRDKKEIEAMYAITYILAKKMYSTLNEDLQKIAIEISEYFGCGFDAIIRVFRSMHETSTYRELVDVEDRYGLNHLLLK